MSYLTHYQLIIYYYLEMVGEVLKQTKSSEEAQKILSANTFDPTAYEAGNYNVNFFR